MNASRKKNIWKHLTLGTAFRWTLAPEAPSRCRPGAEIKDGAGRSFLDPNVFEIMKFPTGWSAEAAAEAFEDAPFGAQIHTTTSAGRRFSTLTLHATPQQDAAPPSAHATAKTMPGRGGY